MGINFGSSRPGASVRLPWFIGDPLGIFIGLLFFIMGVGFISQSSVLFGLLIILVGLFFFLIGIIDFFIHIKRFL